MALDALIDSNRLNTEMTATATAIRNKTGETEKIAWKSSTGFAEAINSIPTINNIGEFTAVFNNSDTVFGWMFVMGQTFEEFINSKYNNYGNVSNSNIAIKALLKITGTKIHMDGYNYYVLMDGNTQIKPTDTV